MNFVHARPETLWHGRAYAYKNYRDLHMALLGMGGWGWGVGDVIVECECVKRARVHEPTRILKTISASAPPEIQLKSPLIAESPGFTNVSCEVGKHKGVACRQPDFGAVHRAD